MKLGNHCGVFAQNGVVGVFAGNTGIGFDLGGGAEPEDLGLELDYPRLEPRSNIMDGTAHLSDDSSLATASTAGSRDVFWTGANPTAAGSGWVSAAASMVAQEAEAGGIVPGSLAGPLAHPGRDGPPAAGIVSTPVTSKNAPVTITAMD